MKFIQRLAAVTAVVIAVSACSKEKIKNPATAAEKKLASIEENDGSTTELFKYTYNAAGQLIHIDYGQYYEEITYNSNGVDMYTKSVAKNDPADFRTKEYKLNASGAVSQRVEKYANGNLYATEDCFYNAEGILVKVTVGMPNDPDFSRNEYDVQDGLVTESRLYVQGSFFYKTLYTYDMTKTLKNYNQFWRNYPVLAFGGKIVSRPVASSKTYNAAGQLIADKTFSYQWDANGNCTKITKNDAVGGNTSVTTIAYQ